MSTINTYAARNTLLRRFAAWHISRFTMKNAPSSCLFILLCSLAGLTSAAGDAQPTPAILSPEQVTKLLEEGKRVLMQGIPDTAINKYFDPVIQSFTQAHRDPNVQVYSSHGMTETLIYMATAGVAQEKRKSQTSVIALDGTWTDALVLKAYALSELRRPDDAKTVLQQAIALSPNYPAPWIELGSVYQSAKDWPAAMDAYQHAEDATDFMEDGQTKNENLGRAFRGKGFVLTELGKLDESEALYKRCLKLNPDDGMAKQELAYIADLRKAQASKIPETAPATTSAPPEVTPGSLTPTAK